MLNAALTLAWLRTRMFLNRSFHGMGVANLAAAAMMGLSMATLAAGVGFGFGVFFHVVNENAKPAALAFVFNLALGVVFGIVLLAPLVVAGGGQGIDPRRLLIFPLSPGRLYALLLGSELLGGPLLFAYPTLLAAAVWGIVLPGRAVPASLGVLVLFIAVTAVWANLLALGLQGFLRNRRLREVFVVVVAFVLIGIGFLPHAIDQALPRMKSSPLFHSTLDRAAGAVSILPSVQASRAILALRAGGGAWPHLGGLVLSLVAGSALGLWVFRRTVLDVPSGGEGGKAVPFSPPAAPGKASRLESALGRVFAPATLAVWAKDRSIILRSSVGKLNLLITPLITLFFATVFYSERLGPFAGYEPREYVFLLLAFYVSMLATNLSGNLFAWEGRGVKAYFTAPAAGRNILLGKDLAVWSFCALLFVEFCAAYALSRGLPGPRTLACGALCFCIAVVVYALAGNFLSILFPKKNDIAAWRMSAPSNMAVVANMVVLIGVLVLLAVSVLLPGVLGAGAWTPLVLLAVLGPLAAGFRLSLGPAERLMAARREDLIRTLGSTD